MIDLHVLMFRICICLLCIPAAMIDLKKRIIPDCFVIGTAVFGLLSCIARIVLGQSISAVLTDCIPGALTGLIIMLLSSLTVKNGIGNGDVKLVTALGFAFGIEGVFPLLIISFLCAAIFDAVLLMMRKMSMKSTVPLAPFILAGCFSVCILSALPLFNII